MNINEQWVESVKAQRKRVSKCIGRTFGVQKETLMTHEQTERCFVFMHRITSIAVV